MALVAAIFGPEHFIVYSAAEVAISPESLSAGTNIRVRTAAPRPTNSVALAGPVCFFDFSIAGNE